MLTPFLLLALSLPAQQLDAALKDRVAQLLEKLDAPKAEARDEAQAALIKLGPRILPLIPAAAKTDSAERKDRLTKVRDALVEAQEQVSYEASRITLKGQGLRLSEAVKQLQLRTNNPITDLREQNGEDVTNPSLDLEIDNQPFFQAFDSVARKAGITPYFYTGDGTLGFMGGSGGAGLPNRIGEDPYEPLVTYSGPFRIAFRQVLTQRNLQTGVGTADAEFEIAWEPRIRPMLLALKAEDVEIVDDLGNPVVPSVTAESGSVVLRQENPVVDAHINMDAPSRDAKKLARFRVKAQVTVPAAVRSFKFPTLATKKEVTQTQGDVSVTLEDTEVEESNWKVRVKVTMPGEGPAFESYRQGLFNNRLWLQKADGSRFEHNGGFNNTGVSGGTLGFEYIFVDAPGKLSDYQFVYETPGKVITIPLEFEFKDVPLP